MSVFDGITPGPWKRVAVAYRHLSNNPRGITLPEFFGRDYAVEAPNAACEGLTYRRVADGMTFSDAELLIAAPGLLKERDALAHRVNELEAGINKAIPWLAAIAQTESLDAGEAAEVWQELRALARSEEGK